MHKLITSLATSALLLLTACGGAPPPVKYADLSSSTESGCTLNKAEPDGRFWYFSWTCPDMRIEGHAHYDEVGTCGLGEWEVSVKNGDLVPGALPHTLFHGLYPVEDLPHSRVSNNTCLSHERLGALLRRSPADIAKNAQ